jgi:hypothetical protein
VPIVTSSVFEETIDFDASSLENTWFLLSAPSSKALKKALLGDNPMFSFQ